MALPIALGIGSLAAGLLGGHQQEQAQLGEIKEQERFQEQMSNTAWQRGVKDMEAAGINPLAQFAQPASSPSGSVLPMPNILTPAVSSAMDAMRMKNELDTGASQRGLLGANSAKALADAALSRAQAKSVEQSVAGKGKFDSHVYSTLDSVIDGVKSFFNSSALSSVSQQPSSATMLQRQVNAANERKLRMRRYPSTTTTRVRDVGPGPVDSNDR